jgi:hypothetical protein
MNNVVELKTLTLVPGDWIAMEYGFTNKLFYVHSVYPHGVCICTTSWCVSDMECHTFAALGKRGFMYIGRTKAKWYWRFLPFRDVICPYYAPRGLLA